MTRRTLSLLLSLTIALLTAVGVYIIRAVEEPRPPTPTVVPVAVEIARIEPRPFTRRIETLGTVQALREAAVSAKVAGPLARLDTRAELGAPVTPGILLAQVDPTPFGIDIRQREAGRARAQARVHTAEVEMRRQASLIAISRDKLRLARAEQDRLVDLLQRELIAKQDAERAELGVRRAEEELARAESGLREAEALRQVALAELAAAEADVDRARQALADTEVRAPFEGVISEKRATVGEHVAPGAVLFRIADLSALKVVVRVPGDDVALLRSGTAAEVRAAGLPQGFSGTVAFVGPQADTATRTYPVEILVRQPEGRRELRPGMFARATIPIESYPAAILVPRSSVIGESTAPVVFVADLDRGVAHRREVTIARTLGDRHLLAGGLARGDLLIVAGHHLLQDGTAIRAVETRTLAP